MQIANARTPIDRCETLALFLERMISRFPDNAALTPLGTKIQAATEALAGSQRAYLAGVKALAQSRADVKFADWEADRGVRATQRSAETADGKKEGRIGAQIFPGGMTPIVRPVGGTQVDAMRDLEGRVEAVAASWAAAAGEKAKLLGLRTRYEAALVARHTTHQKVSDLRSARNAAREDFLDIYAEVANRIRAEFPRDRAMQDLFFDAVVGAGPEHDGAEVDDSPAPIGTSGGAPSA